MGVSSLVNSVSLSLLLRLLLPQPVLAPSAAASCFLIGVDAMLILDGWNMLIEQGFIVGAADTAIPTVAAAFAVILAISSSRSNAFSAIGLYVDGAKADVDADRQKAFEKLMFGFVTAVGVSVVATSCRRIRCRS